jgi:CIC family chloride channel protein
VPLCPSFAPPLTAVVFVAETTGGHSYIIPSLIGAAVAYAISGEASVSGDQHLHETAKLAELSGMFVRDVMQHNVVSAQASSTIREFVESVAIRHKHTIFPIYENGTAIATIFISDVTCVPPTDWDRVTTGELADRDAIRVTDDCDLSEALRLLVRERGPQMVLVIDDAGAMQGVVTKTDILRAVRMVDQPTPARRITRRVPTSPGASGTAL